MVYCFTKLFFLKKTKNYRKEKGSFASYLLMENNMQNRPPKRKKLPITDLILIALAVLVIFRIDWGNMNSFHYLILFLLLLCFMLRWSNMRKEAQRKEAMARRKAEEARLAEEIPAADTANEAVPTENPVDATPAEAKPSEEKTEE